MDKRRYNRLAAAKSRKSKRSYKTELENAQILLAWLNADLSEGQASKALNIDRIALREMRDTAIAEGLRLFESMYPKIDAAYDGICAPLRSMGGGS
jgi:hypothetical protein